jgi:hypothetical protein
MTNLDTSPVTARDTRGITPVRRLMMNGEALDVRINEAALSFVPGQHDQAKLTCTSSELETTEGMLDSCLSFAFGQAPRIETFWGYIVDVEEHQDSQGMLSFVLTVHGPTKVMYEGAPRYWVNQTIPDAIRNLVYRNLLGYAGHAHTHVWSALAQTQESDWQMLNRLARRIGFTVFHRYGVIMVQDALQVVNDDGIYTRLVAGGSGDGLSDDRYLIEFQPSEKADVAKENLGIKYGYFTTNNRVQVATQPGEFKGYIFEADTVLRDQTESEVYTEAIDRATEDWKQHSMARIWGDADIYPGMNVEVVTSSPRYLRAQYDGKWMVKAIGHQMDNQQFQTMLYLCRPSSDVSESLRPYRSFWADDTLGRSRPNLTLEEDRWVSSWTDRRVRNLL